MTDAAETVAAALAGDYGTCRSALARHIATLESNGNKLAAWPTAWTAAPDAAARTSVLILFATVAIFHTLWSPLFFRVRRPDWALVEIIFLWGSLVALFIGLWPISHQASLLILPYLLWVSFATWLNSAIVRLNRPFAR